MKENIIEKGRSQQPPAWIAESFNIYTKLERGQWGGRAVEEPDLRISSVDTF